MLHTFGGMNWVFVLFLKKTRAYHTLAICRRKTTRLKGEKVTGNCNLWGK
jgi:hypothetical protein